MDLSLESVDLCKEVSEVAELFERRVRESGISLQIESCEAMDTERAPPDTTPSLENSVRAKADRRGLRIVLRNLVSNAIKYTDEGGQVWIRIRRQGGKGVLEVEDTGVGMNPEKVHELFDAFKQESEGKRREYEGTGLGLAVTQRLLEEMGGEIEVETEKGTGSRFTVHLPRTEGGISDKQTPDESLKE